MPRLKEKVPNYRLHRRSGQAVVTLNSKDFYLGPHGSEPSREAYDRLIQEWLSNNRMLPGQNPVQDDRDINELLVAYWDFAKAYYLKEGRPTGELNNIRDGRHAAWVTTRRSRPWSAWTPRE